MRLETWNKKLAKLSEAHKAGKVVWFARPGFTDPDYSHLDPKFHKFKDRTEGSERWDRVWTAQCGYEREFSEGLLHEFPNVRLQAPPVAQRCRKCNR